MLGHTTLPSFGARALVSVAFTSSLSCAPGTSQPGAGTSAAAMFRGDAAHDGRYQSSGPEHFGGLVWRFTTAGPVRSSPTIFGDMLYVGSGDGNLYALDRPTGAERWRFAAGAGIASAPAVSGDLVIVSTEDAAVVAVDRRTGAKKWRVSFGENAPLAWGRASGDIYTSSPAIAGGAVIVGGGDGTVRALDIGTGAERWKFTTGGRVRSSPAVANGIAYVGGFDGIVYALDAATGALRWKFTTEGASLDSKRFGYDRRSIQSSPAIAGGALFIGSRDGSIYAIDAKTGQQRWRVLHDGTSWSINSPALSDSVVYEGSSDAHFFHALRQSDGHELWRITTNGTVWSSPALAGRTVFFGSGGGTITAADITTGAERWKYQTAGPIHSSPVIADGMLYVGSGDGAVYAIRGGDHDLARAVFWDTALVTVSMVRSHSRVRDQLRVRGYEVLDTVALQRWMTARVADRTPSVVVFAIDYAPASVARTATDTVLMRRYLDAGGKIVWLSTPPLMWPPDATGERPYSQLNIDAPKNLLGVDHSAAQFDRLGAHVTDAGARWGLSGWWLGSWSIKPDPGIDVLAADEFGNATAWTRRYGGPPGTGYVQLGRADWTDESLRQLAAVADYRP